MAGAGQYVTFREEKQLAGERRGKPIHKRKFFLVDTSGQDHLVATGEDTGSGDGHYVYRGSHAGTTPVSCTSRRKLNGWLQSIIAGIPPPLMTPGDSPTTLPPTSSETIQAALSTGPQTQVLAAQQATAPAAAPAGISPTAEPGPSALGLMATLPHGDVCHPLYRTYRKERFRAEDGLRRIRYHFICHDGTELLAVNAKEIKSSGGHYAYHAAPDFGPRVWKNGGDVRRWLASLCTNPDPVLTPALPGSNPAATWGPEEGPLGTSAAAAGGLIRDPDRRRALVDSTLAAVAAKMDMLRRRAGVECTLTVIGLDSDVRMLATSGVAAAQQSPSRPEQGGAAPEHVSRQPSEAAHDPSRSQVPTTGRDPSMPAQLPSTSLPSGDGPGNVHGSSAFSAENAAHLAAAATTAAGA